MMIKMANKKYCNFGIKSRLKMILKILKTLKLIKRMISQIL